MRFVEQDRRLRQRPPAHEGERRDLDHAGLDAAFDHPPFHEIVKGVVNRAQIGIDLVAHVAGQETEPLAGLDRGARENQAFDDSLLEQRHRMADGEPGLAGSRRSLGEDEFVLAQRGEIAILRGVAGAHDAAAARLDMAEAVARRLEFAGKQRALIGGFLDHAFDVAFAGGLAELGAFVEQLENATRLLARFARPANDDLVAVGVRGDAETALDARDVLIVVAEDDRSQAVVVESERDLRRFGLAVVRRERRRRKWEWSATSGPGLSNWRSPSEFSNQTYFT